MTRLRSRNAAHSRLYVAAAALAATALVLTACSSDDDSGGGGAATGAAATGTATGACAAYNAYMGHDGTSVTMYASIISPESDSLQKSWAEFEQCTGIKINYEGANDFESQLPVRVQGGNAPDLAVIPQPGLVQRMVQTGKAIPAAEEAEANVDKYWNEAWKGYATVDGKFYGAPMSANMKSMVWYSPKMFADAGLKVPTTWEDLMSLGDQIAGLNKGKAWCGGIGSGTATGWPATDWLEQIVLRQYGGDVYDKWISHEIKFDSPEIKGAMQTVADWMQNPDWVNGGFGDVKTIATTTFQDAGKPILQGQCWMLQQASFYAAQWPEGTKVGPDGDVFAFFMPEMSGKTKLPVEGGGEFVVAFGDRPEVKAVQAYLSTPEWAASRVKVAPGWVSANNGVDPGLYKDPIDQLSVKYLTDESATFRFDASDLMPAPVGSGAMWKEFTAWFGEGKSIDAVAKAIDGAWPS